MSCTCGLPTPEACESLQHAVILRENEDLRLARWLRLRVDCYCLQHPPYVHSTKSYAAHWLGLAIALNHDNDPRLFQAIAAWQYGHGEVERPALPPSFGALTVAHLVEALDPETYQQRLFEWARSIWEAYADHQRGAEDWLERARKRFYGER